MRYDGQWTKNWFVNRRVGDVGGTHISSIHVSKKGATSSSARILVVGYLPGQLKTKRKWKNCCKDSPMRSLDEVKLFQLCGDWVTLS